MPDRSPSPERIIAAGEDAKLILHEFGGAMDAEDLCGFVVEDCGHDVQTYHAALIRLKTLGVVTDELVPIHCWWQGRKNCIVKLTSPCDVPTEAPDKRPDEELNIGGRRNGANASDGSDAEHHMEQIAAAVGDENAVQIIRIARSKLSGNERMDEIVGIDRRFAPKSSEFWGNLLSVSSSAIRGYETWKRLRREDKSTD